MPTFRANSHPKSSQKKFQNFNNSKSFFKSKSPNFTQSGFSNFPKSNSRFGEKRAENKNDFGSDFGNSLKPKRSDKTGSKNSNFDKFSVEPKKFSNPSKTWEKSENGRNPSTFRPEASKRTGKFRKVYKNDRRNPENYFEENSENTNSSNFSNSKSSNTRFSSKSRLSSNFKPDFRNSKTTNFGKNSRNEEKSSKSFENSDNNSQRGFGEKKFSKFEKVKQKPEENVWRRSNKFEKPEAWRTGKSIERRLEKDKNQNSKPSSKFSFGKVKPKMETKLKKIRNTQPKKNSAIKVTENQNSKFQESSKIQNGKSDQNWANNSPHGKFSKEKSQGGFKNSQRNPVKVSIEKPEFGYRAEAIRQLRLQKKLKLEKAVQKNLEIKNEIDKTEISKNPENDQDKITEESFGIPKKTEKLKLSKLENRQNIKMKNAENSANSQKNLEKSNSENSVINRKNDIANSNSNLNSGNLQPEKAHFFNQNFENNLGNSLTEKVNLNLDGKNVETTIDQSFSESLKKNSQNLEANQSNLEKLLEVEIKQKDEISNDFIISLVDGEVLESHSMQESILEDNLENNLPKIIRDSVLKNLENSKNLIENSRNLTVNSDLKADQSIPKTMKDSDKMPQIIILYGPPASGKGTQADFLKKLLPDYFHLDFGTALRGFVSENLGNYFDPIINKKIMEEIQDPNLQQILFPKNTQKSKESSESKGNYKGNAENELANQNELKDELKTASEKLEKSESLEKNEIEITPKNRAYRIWQALMDFEAVDFRDLQFVIATKLTKFVQNNQKVILEGPGRSVLEAQWLSGLFAELKLEIAIFHLYISPSETVKRSATRFYVKGVEKPFISYKIAKESGGGEPYRRPEDEDSDGIMNRYNRLYADIFAQIISIYQLKAKAKVLTVDAHQTVEKVSQTLYDYLQKWYNWQK